MNAGQTQWSTLSYARPEPRRQSACAIVGLTIAGLLTLPVAGDWARATFLRGPYTRAIGFHFSTMSLLFPASAIVLCVAGLIGVNRSPRRAIAGIALTLATVAAAIALQVGSPW